MIGESSKDEGERFTEYVDVRPWKEESKLKISELRETNAYDCVILWKASRGESSEGSCEYSEIPTSTRHDIHHEDSF